MKTIFKNGDIYTMDGDVKASSMAVEDGKIIALDVSEEDERFRDAEVVDLNRKTVIPAFHDSHQHFLCYATDKEKIDFFNARSIEDMANLTQDYIRRKGVKKGQWIQGGGWNENNFPDHKLPTRQDLDKFCPDHPAIFTRTCCSVAVANTLALQKAGILDDPPEMEDGVIVVDENGSPTGMLEERARFKVYDSLPKYSKEQLKEFILHYQDDLLKCGLATVQTDDFKLWDAKIEDILEAYKELDQEKKLKVRFIEQIRLIDHVELDAYLKDGKRTGEGSDFFKVGAYKLLPDGSLGGKTAALREPYENDEGNRGIFVYDKEMFYSLLEKAHTHGMQLAIHAIGDRTMDIILDCYETLQKKYPKADPRYRIIHCQITGEDTLDRFAAQDVIADIQPLFIRADMDIAEALLGKERLRTSYNWKTMLKKGIKISGSSDAPVESFDPMLAIHSAVTFTKPDGTPEGGWMPDQRLTVEEAVRMYTCGAAYTAYEEAYKGKLTEGYLADFILLSQNIFDVRPEEIIKTKVEKTFVGGVEVYSAGSR